MARFAINLPSGTTDQEGFLRLFGKVLSGSGVIGSGDMTVAAQATPDMTVSIATGDAAIFSAATLYHGWANTPENVTIPANASGVTKITAIVAAVDTAAASTTANNPNGLVYQTFTLGGTDTATPTDAQISTGIGGRPFTRLANVTVGNGVTSINAGNIADARVVSGLAPERLASQAWSNYTPTWTGSTTAPALGNGTITGHYARLGRSVTVRIRQIMGSTTTYGSGRWAWTLPFDPAPSSGIHVAVGSGYFEKSATQGYMGMATLLRSDEGTQANQVVILYPSGSSTTPAPIGAQVVTHSSIAWAAADFLSLTFTYEAAS
ncbi:MAG: hypothetical protein M3Q71_00040 [Chloroflexota bacterium]|nr:hypothetical protein [Chloroflexota bacterium]